MNNPYPSETGCCARFDPTPWDEKEFQWKDKLFIKDKVRCFMYMPLNFGKVIVRCMEKIDKAAAVTPEPPLALSDHLSPWTMELYVEVAKQVPQAEMVTISGTFLSKVFEGPYKETRHWCKQMQEWVAEKGKEIQQNMIYYTTCPKCARHYGKNYVVYFAKVS